MNPNATLLELRALLDELANYGEQCDREGGTDPAVLWDIANDIALRVRALDAWMSASGSTPNDWM